MSTSFLTSITLTSFKVVLKNVLLNGVKGWLFALDHVLIPTTNLVSSNYLSPSSNLELPIKSNKPCYIKWYTPFSFSPTPQLAKRKEDMDLNLKKSWNKLTLLRVSISQFFIISMMKLTFIGSTFGVAMECVKKGPLSTGTLKEPWTVSLSQQITGFRSIKEPVEVIS